MSVQQFDISPVPKPRMTQRDRWAKRPVVLRYFLFKDSVRAANVHVPDSGSTIIFILPMPRSWSRSKRDAMDGQPHQQKPDIDNLTKALLDAVFDDDSRVHSICTRKVWGASGQIIIEQSRAA